MSSLEPSRAGGVQRFWCRPSVRVPDPQNQAAGLRPAGESSTEALWDQNNYSLLFFPVCTATSHFPEYIP